MTTIVLTGYNDRFAPLGDLTTPLMSEYAARHGFDFDCFRTERPPIYATWRKVRAVIDGLISHDRVIWIDADMKVTNMDYQPVYRNGFHASRDWGEDATTDYHFSTGAFVACTDALPLFLDVNERMHECMAQGLWEQEEIRKAAQNHLGHVHIHPRREFNAVASEVHDSVVEPWQPGDWLAHFTMVPLEERVALFHKY